jgi:predicted lipoprotein with Yx(FWY)xxD motif
MRHGILSVSLFSLAMTVSPLAASAQEILTCADGSTLYSYDMDVDGKPTCDAECVKKWPPYYHASGNEVGEKWSVVTDASGTEQWAYDGKPVYYFAGDANRGDTNGDGVGGVWHVILK